MRKKWICVLLIVFLCLMLFFSCSKQKNKENVDAYSVLNQEVVELFSFSRESIDNGQWKSRLKESFLRENTTKNLIIGKENGKMIYDTTSPEKRGYLIKDQEELDTIFDMPPEIDFDKNMIVLVFYSLGSRNVGYELKNMAQNENSLDVEINIVHYKSDNSMDPFSPKQRVVCWKVNKMEVTDLQVILNKSTIS